jgi:hypothetical protein
LGSRKALNCVRYGNEVDPNWLEFKRLEYNGGVILRLLSAKLTLLKPQDLRNVPHPKLFSVGTGWKS